VNGYDLISATTDLTVTAEAPVIEVTALGDSTAQFMPLGLVKLSVSQDGFYDDVLDANWRTLLGYDSAVLVIGLAGNAIGRPAICTSGSILAKYQRKASRSDLHRATGEITAETRYSEAVIGADLIARTTAGNTAAIDNGAATTSGIALYLEVKALTLGGYTNAIVKAQHSTDGSTYVDLTGGSFTVTTTGGWAATVTGTVNRYTRWAWSWTGTGSGQSITFLAGQARG